MHACMLIKIFLRRVKTAADINLTGIHDMFLQVRPRTRTKPKMENDCVRSFTPELMSVEGDFFGEVVVVPALLHVQALVGVVLAAVLAVEGEPVEAVVGVLDVHDAVVVVDVLVSLEDGAVGLALDRDVCIGPPTVVPRF